MIDEIPEVILSDQVKEQMAKDPEIAEAMRDFSAIARQAMEGLKSGKYPSFEEAIFILTGERPEKIEFDEDDVE